MDFAPGPAHLCCLATKDGFDLKRIFVGSDFVLGGDESSGSAASNVDDHVAIKDAGSQH